jgi:mannosyltransferase OCH1-like enzyme
MIIPKIIHQIWFQGYDNLPEHLQAYHLSWKNKHPDYRIIVWDEHSIYDLIHNTKNEIIINLYFSYGKMIQKIDFAKYVILYIFGGIYIDMDVNCLNSLDNILLNNSYECILSKMPYNTVQRYLLTCIGYSLSDDLINNGIMMTIPKHELFLFIIQEAIEQKNHYIQHISSMMYIFISTGPLCLSNAYKKYKNNIDNINNTYNIDTKIHILDNTYFEACDIHNVKKDCIPPKHAIGSHIYEGSWVTGSENILVKLYFFLYNYFLFILFIILCIYYIYLTK